MLISWGWIYFRLGDSNVKHLRIRTADRRFRLNSVCYRLMKTVVLYFALFVRVGFELDFPAAVAAAAGDVRPIRSIDGMIRSNIVALDSFASGWRGIVSDFRAPFAPVSTRRKKWTKLKLATNGLISGQKAKWGNTRFQHLRRQIDADMQGNFQRRRRWIVWGILLLRTWIMWCWDIAWCWGWRRWDEHIGTAICIQRLNLLVA